MGKQKYTFIIGIIVFAYFAYKDIKGFGQINWVADLFITAVVMIGCYWLSQRKVQRQKAAERRKREKEEIENRK